MGKSPLAKLCPMVNADQGKDMISDLFIGYAIHYRCAFSSQIIAHRGLRNKAHEQKGIIGGILEE
jgi:hypothetical protein